MTLVILTGGCNKMSEEEVDETAGLNGSFEVSRNGLPVNWLMYTPGTVKDAEFTILLDNQIVKEGRQSLKFVVARCSPRGGTRSPGFTNEFFEAGRFRGPGKYKLNFWIRNDSATYQVMAGGVSLKEGEMRVLVKDDSKADEWKQLEYTIDVPNEQWLRMQLNILSPGTFWIDAVEIEKIG